MLLLPLSSFFFFFNDTATTEIYTLSLHDALPISHLAEALLRRGDSVTVIDDLSTGSIANIAHLKKNPRFSYVIDTIMRSEEHTSELQSRLHLVCRLLLEKKKKKTKSYSRYR